MKSARFILAATALSLAFSSCLKQDNEPRGMTDSGFRLSGISWSDGKAVRFRYDGDNRIERIEYGRGRYTTASFDVLDSYWEYKYLRGRCNQVYYHCFCDSDSHRRTFVYDEDGRVILAESHAADGRFTSFTKYRYDGTGRLAEARDSAASIVSQRIFSYGEDENLSSMTIFRSGPAGATRERREWRMYDSGHSYIHEIPGLPVDDVNLDALRGYITWTRNNYLGERVYQAVPEDEPQRVYIDTELRYTYDANGLPVQLDLPGKQARFVYEKY